MCFPISSKDLPGNVGTSQSNTVLSPNAVVVPSKNVTTSVITSTTNHHIVLTSNASTENVKSNFGSITIPSHASSTVACSNNKSEQTPLRQSEGQSSYTSAALDLRHSPSIVSHNGNTHSNPGEKNFSPFFLFTHFCCLFFSKI